MGGAASHAAQRTRRDDQGFVPDVRKSLQEAERKVSPLLDFWTKLNNDWIFNFSGTLAYGLLTAIFPILLVIVAIGGFLLGAVSPDARAQLENGIAGALPGGASGAGGEIVHAATQRLNNSASALLALGIVTALIGGSGLFITMESVFGVIFRLRSRGFLRQRLMAIGMLLLFAILTPLIMLASIVPPAVVGILGLGDNNRVAGFFIQALGPVIAFACAVMLFGAIYVVVPNKPVNLREAWKGTLVAAALLMLYELLFPLYESNFLNADNYGALVGFVVVIIVFFYYLAFILLLGAEVNSWALGQRQTAAPINAILHEVQAHNTTRGAAGPTAGQPQEDLEGHEGAVATGDAQSSKDAEPGVTSPRYAILDEKPHGSERGTSGSPAANGQATRGRTGGDEQRRHTDAQELHQRPLRLMHPLTSRQRTTLAVLAASGAVVLVGAARFIGRLIARNDHRTPAERQSGIDGLGT